MKTFSRKYGEVQIISETDTMITIMILEGEEEKVLLKKFSGLMSEDEYYNDMKELGDKEIKVTEEINNRPKLDVDMGTYNREFSMKNLPSSMR